MSNKVLSEAGISWKLKDIKYFIYLKQVGTYAVIPYF